MPVIKMEIIKFPVFFEPQKVVYHSPAHTITVLNDVIAMRPAVVIVNFTDYLVLYLATGKIVNIVVLCQGFSEMGCGACKSPTRSV